MTQGVAQALFVRSSPNPTWWNRPFLLTCALTNQPEPRKCLLVPKFALGTSVPEPRRCLPVPKLGLGTSQARIITDDFHDRFAGGSGPALRRRLRRGGRRTTRAV